MRLRAQHGDEVAQFFFNLSRRCYRVRDFLTQQLSVTLSQSMEGLFDRVLGHAKLARNLRLDRKSTRLNSSHVAISYAVFCLKKKNKKKTKQYPSESS